MIIAVDVDDVCAALVPAWQKRYNEKYSDNLTPADWASWDVTKLVKPECGAAIYEFLKEPDLYDDVHPIDGAAIGVGELRRAGHEVLFVTSCGYDPKTIGASAGAKLDWLQRHGFLPKDRTAVASYIVAAEKSRVIADVLIDDRASTIEKWPKRGLLFDRAHNQDFSPLWPSQRVMNWIDAVRTIGS